MGKSKKVQKKPTTTETSILKGLKKNIRTKSLSPANVPRVRRELLDADYLTKLSKEEYLWYAQFTDEWTNAAIEKTSDGKVKRGHIHTTNEMARNIYDANNKRNNDVYTVTKALNLMSELDVRVGENNDYIESRQVSNTNLTETALIADLERADLKDIEYLTKREFIKMVKNGASIPKEMYNFYIDFYKLEFKKA